MSENLVRHLIAIIGSIVCLVVYWAGYVAGSNGWIWTIVGVLLVYVAIYKIVDV